MIDGKQFKRIFVVKKDIHVFIMDLDLPCEVIPAGKYKILPSSESGRTYMALPNGHTYTVEKLLKSYPKQCKVKYKAPRPEWVCTVCDPEYPCFGYELEDGKQIQPSDCIHDRNATGRPAVWEKF